MKIEEVSLKIKEIQENEEKMKKSFDFDHPLIQILQNPFPEIKESSFSHLNEILLLILKLYLKNDVKLDLKLDLNEINALITIVTMFIHDFNENFVEISEWHPRCFDS